MMSLPAELLEAHRDELLKGVAESDHKLSQDERPNLLQPPDWL